ncbi:hypothetical protein ACKGJO_06335 [Gracilimonas sp. Q87]|uniref:hypothetical protein n=1 Tax=Gracilimonas sp. Q87 TaxID=3384766 RepID=UPI0039844643
MNLQPFCFPVVERAVAVDNAKFFHIDIEDQVSLHFEFNSGEVFEAEADQVEFLEESVATTQITFDPVFWFSDVTSEMLDNASRDANGVIVISETSNAEIFSNVADKLDVATQATFQ